MPAPLHYRLSFSGLIGTGQTQEIFSHGLAVATGTTSQPIIGRPAMATLATTLSNAWATHMAPMVCAVAQLTRVRVALVENTGNVSKDGAGTFQQGDWLGSKPGVGGPLILPPQLSVAVSLQSAASGPTGRGRFFVPSPQIGTLGADLRLATPVQQDFVTFCTAFVAAVNTAAAAVAGGSLGRVVVPSGGSVSQGIAPANRPVTQVRVGRVVDTMRSRRNALLEAYVVGAVPA